MATLDERIAELKSQGKSESTSKSLAKLVKERERSGGSTQVYGNTGLSAPDTGVNTVSLGSFEDTIKKAVEANRQAVNPAVESLKAGIPEVQQTFSNRRTQLEAEKSPLTERFNNLLERVKGTFESQRNQATQTTTNELARRGITSSSGFADRELQGALSPILKEEGQTYTDIGLERESQMRALENAITNLVGEEGAAVRALLNSAAGYQAQAGLASIPQALQLMGINQSADQFNKSFGLNESNNALQERLFNLVTLPTSQANIQNIMDIISKRTTGGPGSDWELR